MATSGSIQTLFKDREQTEAIFPRTKVRAVTDDDGNRLDIILEDVVHIGDKVIDTSSVPVNVDTLGGIPAEDYATQSWVKNEIANIQAGGEVDFSGFASKDDVTLLNKRIEELDYPVDSVNEKTGAVVLNAEDVGAHPNTWMPTAEQVGARPDNWMPSASDVGAAPASGFESYHGCASVEELDTLIDTLTKAQKAGTEKTYYIYLYWYSGATLPTGRWSVTIHRPDMGDGTLWASVTATIIASQRIHRLQKELYDGTWLDWEWENPYFEQYTEYRTNERFKNISVYKKVDANNIVQARLDGEDTWVPYAQLLGSVLVNRGNLTGYNDFNTATNTGVHYCNTWAGSGGANFPNDKDSGMLVVFHPVGAFVQQIYFSDSDGIIRRMKWDDEEDWKPWEYENPPAKLGIEYRTTERWNGQPVYTMVDGIGTLPNNSHKVWTHGINVSKILRYSGTTDAGAAIPYYYDGHEINLECDPVQVILTTNFDATALGIYYVRLWYTKA